MCKLQVDHDGTFMHAECMDSSGTDCNDSSDIEDHLAQCNGAITQAPADSLYQHNVAMQHAPVLDADGVQTACKPLRRHAQRASHHVA